MKQLIALVLLCSSTAHSAEYNLGGVTYHFAGPNISRKFSNQLGDQGNLIATPTLGVTWNDSTTYPGEYTSKTVFTALNSVAEPVVGSLLQMGHEFRHSQLGLVMGLYVQDNRHFRSRDLGPYIVAEIGDAGIVPVVGLAINYKIPLANGRFIRFNNIVSPAITNHSLSLGRDF